MTRFTAHIGWLDRWTDAGDRLLVGDSFNDSEDVPVFVQQPTVDGIAGTEWVGHCDVTAAYGGRIVANGEFDAEILARNDPLPQAGHSWFATFDIGSAGASENLSIDPPQSRHHGASVTRLHLTASPHLLCWKADDCGLVVGAAGELL